MATNLWPDFKTGDLPRSPKSVVDEAGRGLKDKTDGVVEFWSGSTQLREGRVYVQCNFYTGKLGYHYPFMWFNFGIQDMYPVKLNVDRIGELQATSEEELINVLARIFNDKSTVATVERLISLSEE